MVAVNSEVEPMATTSIMVSDKGVRRLLKALLEDGIIVNDGGGWALSTRDYAPIHGRKLVRVIDKIADELDGDTMSKFRRV